MKAAKENNQTHTTPLLDSYNCLKKILFKNQYVYYNLLLNELGNPKRASLITTIQRDLKKLYQNQPLPEETRALFYALVTGYWSLFTVDDLFKDAKFRSVFQDSEYPPLKGEIVSYNRENKSKILNGIRELPEVWRNTYSINTAVHRKKYCNELAWLLQFYIVFTGLTNESVPLEQLKGYNKDKSYVPQYYEYFSLPPKSWEKINQQLQKSTPISSLWELAEFLYETLLLQTKDNLGLARKQTLNRIKALGIHSEDIPSGIPKAERSQTPKPTKARSNENTLPSFSKQNDFYWNYIDCYGEKTIDRFNLLKMYAKRNLFCAKELGAIYYYGDTYYNSHEPVYIKRDYDKSMYYFSLCLQAPSVCPSGCWSVGDMLLQKKYIISPRETNPYLRDLYEKFGDNSMLQAKYVFELCGTYGSAKNSLAKIYREWGKDAYNAGDKTNAVAYYVAFLNHAKEATQYGWLYGYNLLYDFVNSHIYEELLPQLEQHRNFIRIEKISMLEEAANMGNPWAKEKLALEYLNPPYSNQKEYIRMAHSLFVEAFSDGQKPSGEYLLSRFFNYL